MVSRRPLAVLPAVNGSPVHPRGLAGYLGSPAQSAPDGSRELPV